MRVTTCHFHHLSPHEEIECLVCSSNLEISNRAKAIIAAIDGRFASSMLREIEQLVEDGKFDQAVERAVRWESLDPAGKNMIPFAASIERFREAEKKRFGKLRDLPKWSPAERLPIEKEILAEGQAKWLESASGPIELTGEYVIRDRVVRAAGLTIPMTSPARHATDLFIISSEDVRCIAEMGMQRNIILSNGSVQVTSSKLECTIVIADGDIVILRGRLHSCILIARGSITMPTAVMMTFVPHIAQNGGT